MKSIHRLLAAAAFALAPGLAGADVVYNTWTTNEGNSGNYILTVAEVAGDLSFNLTVNPWNAEALGLFVDLGDLDLAGGALLSSVSPIGQVSVFATDTTSDSCGAACNLNGLVPPVATPDGEWELVFRLGSQGFNGIQTFAFVVDVPGTTFAESQLGLVGIRSQALCAPGQTLPNGNCTGSDKSYGSPPTTQVPLPGTLALLGLGLVTLAGIGRRSGAHTV